MNTDTYAFKNKMKVNKEREVNGSSQANYKKKYKLFKWPNFITNCFT